MADMVSIGSKSDTGAGSKLKTGSMRRSYSFKKKKRKKKKGFRVANNKREQRISNNLFYKTNRGVVFNGLSNRYLCLITK